MKKTKKYPKNQHAKHKSERRSGGTGKPYKSGNTRSGYAVHRHPPISRNAEGIFSATRHGYGFVTIEGRSDDVFIPADYTKHAMSGDRVRISYRLGGRAEGRVEEILEYGRETLCGVLAAEEIVLRGKTRTLNLVFLPDDKGFPELDVRGDGKSGHKVEVRLIRADGHPPVAAVVRDFGNAESLSANVSAILSENRIETVFSPDVLEDAARAAAGGTSEEESARREFPETPVLTIDSAEAKDLDDAVSLLRLPDGGFLLGVHIADVSHYVKRGSETEAEAIRRGTSVYFVDRVVPMLPEVLSNGVCSLNAGEVKYTLSAYLTLDKNGNIQNTEVRETKIKSVVRGVYSEVNDLLKNGEKSEFYKKYETVYPMLRDMETLYKLRLRAAKKRGAIDFDRPESVILVDEHGEPCDVERRERGVSERIIEQFMTAANAGVATLLRERGYPVISRLHEEPDSERVSAFLDFASAVGLDTAAIRGSHGKEPVAFANLLREAAKKGIGDAVSYVLLRTMAKACYSADKRGHFGLSLDDYCHFTSPIRRLSDLGIHRILKAMLAGDDGKALRSMASSYADAATAGENRALAAERAVEDLYKCLYMSRHIGEEYDAVVSGLTSFGIFAELPNTCEGLIAFAESESRYTFDEKRQIVVGENGSFRIGDRIRVCVSDADIPAARVHFRLINN